MLYRHLIILLCSIWLSTASAADLIRHFAVYSKAPRALAFAPNGEIIVSSNENSPVLKLWDVETGQEMHTLSGHTGGVESMAFAPDGQTILSGGYDNTLRLWDVNTGDEIRSFAGHESTVSGVAFAPDGQTLLSLGYDGTLKHWDALTGNELHRVAVGTHFVGMVTFAPDRQTVAFTDGLYGSLKFSDVQTGHEISVVPEEAKYIDAVAFAPDGQTVLYSDFSLKRLELQTGNAIDNFAGNSQDITALAISPDGQTVLSGQQDGVLRFWELATGHPIHRLQAHAGNITSVAFAPDGQRIASSGEETGFKVWQTPTPAALQTPLIAAFTLTSDSTVIPATLQLDASQSSAGDYEIVEYTWGILSAPLRYKPLGNGQRYSHTQLGSGEHRIVLTITDKAGHQHTTRQHVFFEDSADVIRAFGALSSQPNTAVSAFTFTPDGQTVLLATDDHNLRLWDVQTGDETAILSGHTERVFSIVYMPDGQTAWSNSVDGTIIFWDMQAQQSVYALAHADSVHTIAFSPEGYQMLSASDAQISVWNALTGEHLFTPVIQGYANMEILSAEFTSDGKHIEATISYDRYIGFSLHSKGNIDTTLLELPVDKNTLNPPLTDIQNRILGYAGLTLSLSTRHAYSSAADASEHDHFVTFDCQDLMLLDGATKRLLHTFYGHRGCISDVEFSPDGKTLVSNSYDGALKLWQIPAQFSLFPVESFKLNPQPKAAAIQIEPYVQILRPDATRYSESSHITAIAVAPDGKTLLSRYQNHSSGQQVLWDIQTGDALHDLPSDGGGTAVAFTPDGQAVIAYSPDKQALQLWDVHTYTVTHTFAVNYQWRQPTSIDFSADGQLLLWAEAEHPLRLVDIQTGQVLRYFAVNDDRTATEDADPKPSVTPRTGVFSPDEQSILSIMNTSTVDNTQPPASVWNAPLVLWNAATAEIVRTFTGHDGLINAVAFAPDGQTFVAAGADKIVRLWDVETGQLIRTYEGHIGAVHFVAFAPDGQTLLSGSHGFLRLWDAVTGKQLYQYAGFVNTGAFSPDGRFILFASGDNTIQIHPMPNVFNAPPAFADFTVDVNYGSAPLTVHFDGSAARSGAQSIVQYDWFISSGERYRGLAHPHTFTQPGKHTIALTVTDNAGHRHRTQQSIFVETPVSLQVQLNQATYRVNNVLQFNLVTESFASEQRYDLYAAIVIPEGDFYTFTPIQASAPNEIVTYLADLDLSGKQTFTVFNFTLKMGLGEGRFSACGILTPAGSDPWQLTTRLVTECVPFSLE